MVWFSRYNATVAPGAYRVRLLPSHIACGGSTTLALGRVPGPYVVTLARDRASETFVACGCVGLSGARWPTVEDAIGRVGRAAFAVED
jgi:hypothetical protein